MHGESLVFDDAEHGPQRAVGVHRVARDREVVAVAGVAEAVTAGVPVEPPIERPHHEVRQMRRGRRTLRQVSFPKECCVRVIDTAEFVHRRCRGAQFGEQAGDVRRVAGLPEHCSDARYGDRLEAMPEVDAQYHGTVRVRPGESSR